MAILRKSPFLHLGNKEPQTIRSLRIQNVFLKLSASMGLEFIFLNTSGSVIPWVWT